MHPDTVSFMTELHHVTDGLTFLSESDAPVAVFALEGSGKKALTAHDMRTVGNYPANVPVKKIPFKQLFANATQEPEWYGPEERATAQRFQALVRLFTECLRDIQAFKIGKTIAYDVYVVGRTASGDFAGVSTKIVET
jgi:hypothetical protein